MSTFALSAKDQQFTLLAREDEIERKVRHDAALTIVSQVLRRSDGRDHGEVVAEITELLEACGLAGLDVWRWWLPEMRYKPGM